MIRRVHRFVNFSPASILNLRAWTLTFKLTGEYTLNVNGGSIPRGYLMNLCRSHPNLRHNLLNFNN